MVVDPHTYTFYAHAHQEGDSDKHDLYLVEDCCHAPLAEYKGQIVGTIGDFGGFSFGGKHLSGGVGGAVVTNNDSLWERAVIFSDVALPRANGPPHPLSLQ